MLAWRGNGYILTLSAQSAKSKKIKFQSCVEMARVSRIGLENYFCSFSRHNGTAPLKGKLWDPREEVRTALPPPFRAPRITHTHKQTDGKLRVPRVEVAMCGSQQALDAL